jgi:hypothetical protein|tara:strand:+ start:1543 stop:1884 length:342 start_codon:yes stop_codon:yes gene_type:complete
MKPITIIAPKLLKVMSIVIDIAAITLWPFIISREEMSEDVLRHETIHLAQQKELLVIFFYLLYGWDYLRGLIKYKDKEQAYFRIRFEQEAYEKMFDKEYLNQRVKYNWLKYKV